MCALVKVHKDFLSFFTERRTNRSKTQFLSPQRRRGIDKEEKGKEEEKDEGKEEKEKARVHRAACVWTGWLLNPTIHQTISPSSVK